ncbi:hypothetical protein NT2_35_00020 [Caenibius tardaugens NBRC 16725]|uniref:DUF3489 domain-containing protein n=2 Tax=Caenibius TaxID=2827482 RepID=U3A0N5_9SPHN|nr:DUF3489 domain-containing protein [Caenibius tardaugens NBRC 16725]GAD51214.1 hypothetical protein NT2_35_00020 [Caenibius tardaugens NBRC 16725]
MTRLQKDKNPTVRDKAEPASGQKRRVRRMARMRADMKEAATPSARRQGDKAHQTVPSVLPKVSASPPDAGMPAPSTPKPATKLTLILTLLESEQGATSAQLMTATGWQPHTIRAALTGLRRKGHVIVRGKIGPDTCYRLEKSA